MICETMAGDNRFEIIAKAKHAILDSTNIETDEDEMKVLDNILFRCWQMGWLDKYDDTKKQTGWIPCSERLPNEDGEYLVFYEGPIIGSRIEIMWYGEPLMPNVDVSGKHFYRSDSEWGDIIYDEVIAWMPLPEPYREDGEA